MFDSHDLERSLSKSHVVEMNPMMFYQMVQVVNDAAESLFAKDIEELIERITFLTGQLEDETTSLSQSFESILSEVRHSTRRRNPFEDMTSDTDALDDLKHAAGNSFIRIVLEVISDLHNGFQQLLGIVRGLRPEKVELLSDERYPRTFEQAQTFSIQYQMFGPIVNRFSNHLLVANSCQREILNICSHITGCLDRYYKALNHRHSVEGIKIHFDPITTDVAISIYENVDSHGEIQDGKKPDEISAYTMRKAVLLAESLQTGMLGDFTSDPSKFIRFLVDGLNGLWDSSSRIQRLAHPFAEVVKTITKFNQKEHRNQDSQFKQSLSFIEDLNPQSVTYKEKTGLLTIEERQELEFRNKTLEMVAMLLRERSSVEALIKYILGRKQELRDYNLEENSFYVCKIGNGNPFTGDAPGELTVIPGIKPMVDLSEVIGSGFKEVLEFMSNILDGAKWFDVFLATSPSKKADKSNVLLVGPQGCHRKGQKILMFDGSLKSVERIRVGDLLMGPDSKPRRVLELHRGSEDMVEILPTKGEPWVVNKGHVLTLVRMGHKKLSGEVRDVAVTDYLGWSAYMKREFKLFRVGVEFTHKPRLPLDPYFLGALLGDGSIRACPALTTGDPELVREVYKQAKKFGLHVNPSPDPTSSVTRYWLSGTCHKPNPIMLILRDLGLGGTSTRNKFIPNCYKMASRKDRLKLLAGLIDTDGSLSNVCFDFQSKSKHLANDVRFVACSLGFAAYQSTFQKKDTKGLLRTYYRVKISGDVSLIPVRIPHKKAGERRQIKDVLRTGLTIRELPQERYYGFTLDGDGRYLLGDFTVTHNSGKTEILRGVASNRQSIGIFAQASDFLTCWKGESEKNPKRLFEAGLKIQRESKKQVFFLIDEIDTILNGDRGHAAFGGTNLATEFQVLMDGITSYPHLALWGATNHPERISMPLIRRFSKVIIVGELSQDDRIRLLKQFLAYLPCSESMGNGVLTEASTRLDGAVGDIMRKVVDHVWRTKMSHFVNTQPEAADIVLELLNQGGNKFHPSKFTQKQRDEMHKIMRPFVQVEPQDLIDSVDLHLNNIAIRNEIQTAKLVYENARQFLADVNN
jgi:hypothetical protein